ncbi:MAG: hypothetical protein K6B68_15370, partial [Eubacterium sp.]|nr:hypothetical protein [Eubacterium sp.]
MGVRRKLYSLILSIGMVLGMLTGIPVYAAGETLVVAWPSGWDDGINEPKKSDNIDDYSDGIEIDVKSEATIYLGTSMDDPIKVAQLDAVSVTKENGDPVNDIIIEPFSSGWDDEKNEAIIPDKGFFNIKTGSSGLYFINYGDAKINLRVVMPRYGIYTSDEFTEENVVPLEDGRIYFDSDKGTTYYAHLGFFDYNGVDHQEGEGAPYSAELDIDCDNDKFALKKIYETTFKITIPSGTYESAHIKMFGEIYMNEGERDGYDQRDYDLISAKTGILASWDDYGNFKEEINDYNKYFNDIAVRTERMLSFGWGKSENGIRYVTPYTGTLECISDNKDKIHISKSLDDNGQPRKGLYDISADTSGLYTIKATNGEEISTLVIDIGIPKIGIYSSETASEATFLAAEWTTLNVKKGETYYVIPTPKEDNRKVTSFEVEFDESAPFMVDFKGATITDGNKYTWEYSADYPKPICSFKVYDEFEDELGDAIRCKAIFTDKEDPNDWYNHDGNISVASVKEGFVVSGRWYEESFEENNSNFRRSCDMITFWDGGVHLGIASYKDGIYTVTPIDDISKLRITDTQGEEVSKDDAFISKTYERDGNEITINNDGVYAVRFDKPGEYRIEYTDGESPQYVTVNVDDPVGGFYNQLPEYNDPLKGYINGRKDQKFFYDDDNRTFYFAFRRVLEKDNRGDNDPNNDIERRRYVYSNGKIVKKQDGNGGEYEAAEESEFFTLCRSYHDDETNEDILEPVTDANYAITEWAADVGDYTVIKITLGDKYDGCGLMTRLAKQQREEKQKDNGEWYYTENYLDDNWDDFWVNCEEKKTGFVIAWPDDGDAFPTNLDYFNKNHTVEIGEDMHLAAGFITEDGQGYKVNPVISDISLQDDKGNPVNSDIAQIDLKSGGIFALSVKKCGTYKLEYNNGGKIYYATIEAVLPKIAFYSSTEPSEETLVNDGTTEVFAKKGDKFYLCHNLNSWDLNEIDSIDVSVPGQDKLIIPQEDLKKGRCIYTLEFEDSIHYEMFFNWKDPNRHDQRMFNFQLSFEGLGVSFPGDEGVFDTNPNDYLQLNHVTMRCHEWKCFAIISEDEGIKTVTPIAGTDENLAKFKITYGD